LIAGDEQQSWLIAEARHKGMSWRDIGEASRSQSRPPTSDSGQLESTLALVETQEFRGWPQRLRPLRRAYGWSVDGGREAAVCGPVQDYRRRSRVLGGRLPSDRDRKIAIDPVGIS
jgi:hypothetical protein